MNSTVETNLDQKSIQFEYFCGQIGSTVVKKNCNFTQDYEFHSDDFTNTIQTKVLMERKKSSVNNGDISAVTKMSGKKMFLCIMLTRSNNQF